MENKGSKYDQGKAPLHMIPEEAILGMAQAFAYGAKKYDRFNYRKGISITRLTDSLGRHTLAYLNGEDNDPESGLPHTWHMLANAAMIEYMRSRKPEMDDRFKPEEFVEAAKTAYAKASEECDDPGCACKNKVPTKPEEGNSEPEELFEIPDNCDIISMASGDWVRTPDRIIPLKQALDEGIVKDRRQPGN